jgi:(E)-4-hydroxy-3-methylbut-2-enyl-diphosphate synthase
MVFLQDGLGDTIRVSLTEAPEQEIDPCTKLANLGMKISAEQKGVVSPNRMYLYDLSEG